MPTDGATIQLRIHELRQLFNSIDPSPFRERDLDPDCEEFIVSWAREVPPDRGLRVEIHVDREQPPEELAADVPSAVHSHFAREAALQELHRRRILREGRLSLAIGLVLLVLCEGTAALVPTGGARYARGDRARRPHHRGLARHVASARGLALRHLAGRARTAAARAARGGRRAADDAHGHRRDRQCLTAFSALPCRTPLTRQPAQPKISAACGSTGAARGSINDRRLADDVRAGPNPADLARRRHGPRAVAAGPAHASYLRAEPGSLATFSPASC